MNGGVLEQIAVAIGVVIGWYLLVRLTSLAIFASYSDYREKWLDKIKKKFGKGECTNGEK
jgi:hypothetical protein